MVPELLIRTKVMMAISSKGQVWDGSAYVDLNGPPGPTDFVNDTGAVAPVVRGQGDIWVDSTNVLLSWDANWITPTLLNGWVNYGNDGTDYQTARFRKVLGGLVVTEGLVKNGAIGSVIFNYPPGYRPALTTIILAGGNTRNGTRLDVRGSDGAVFTQTGTNGWIGLNFVFYASQ